MVLRLLIVRARLIKETDRDTASSAFFSQRNSTRSCPCFSDCLEKKQLKIEKLSFKDKNFPFPKTYIMPENFDSSVASAGSASSQLDGLAAPQSFYADELGKGFCDSVINSVASRLPASGSIYSIERLHQKALEIQFIPDAPGSFDKASNSFSDFVNRVVTLHEKLGAFHVGVNAAPPQRPQPGAAGRDSRSSERERASSPAPSPTGGDGASAPKRPRPADGGTSNEDDPFAARGAAFMSTSMPSGPSGNPFALESSASPEARHFAPLLIAINLNRRKICEAVENIGAQLVDLPADKILSASTNEFARAPARIGREELPMLS